MEIHFDGLLREVVPFIGELLEPRRLKERGAREVPPSVARPPELKDLDLDEIAKIALTLQGQREQVADLLALKRIDRRARAFRPCTLLVFRANDGSQVQPAFVVDDEMSEQHETAFAQSRLSKKMAIAGPSPEGPESLPVAVLGQSWSDGAARGLSGGQGRPATDQSSAGSSRILTPHEQPDYLTLALATSRTRLAIISPWITDAIVDSDFVDSLRQRLAAGADVLIGWALDQGQQRAPDADRRARRLLAELDQRFPNLRFSELRHAHPKILVSDRAFGIVTGFNWLSFGGDPARIYGDERGVLISDAGLVDQLFDAAVALSQQACLAPGKGGR